MAAGFREDPRWQAAQGDLLAEPASDEDPGETFARRVLAAHAMWRIERGTEPDAAPPGDAGP